MKREVKRSPKVRQPDDLMDLTVEEFAAMFHTAVLGVGANLEFVQLKAQRVKDTGYTFQAFNVESPYLEAVREVLGDSQVLLVPIAYPIGGQSIEKRLSDLDYAVEHGTDACCISIDYMAALSGNYAVVEKDVQAMEQRFGKAIELVHIVPATLFNDRELIAVCTAIRDGGGHHLKVNPGYGLGSTFEEVSLIKRVFGDAFDVDPSGGIREMKDVAEYVRRGFTVIHSQKSFGFIDEFIKLKEQGVRFNA